MVGKLRARHGVYAVLGNHDHWTDATLITDLFRAEGIRVLINEGLRWICAARAFWLAGVDDTMVGLEDLRWPWPVHATTNQAIAGAQSNYPASRRRADVDLVLSGHTHGGQVAWRSEKSRSGRPRRRMLRGLGRRGKTQIYVTRGLGTVVLPDTLRVPA